MRQAWWQRGPIHNEMTLALTKMRWWRCEKKFAKLLFHFSGNEKHRKICTIALQRVYCLVLQSAGWPSSYIWTLRIYQGPKAWCLPFISTSKKPKFLVLKGMPRNGITQTLLEAGDGNHGDKCVFQAKIISLARVTHGSQSVFLFHESRQNWHYWGCLLI